MGWGCYRHEMDAGSEAWREAADRVCSERLERTHRDWGRDLQVCPLCWEEHERVTLGLRNALADLLEDASRAALSERPASEPPMRTAMAALDAYEAWNRRPAP